MFTIPLLYSFSHYLIGSCSNFSPLLTVVFFLYQFYQYSINHRFFFFDKVKMREGNSFQHTFRKISQYLIGFIITFIIVQYSLK